MPVSQKQQEDLSEVGGREKRCRIYSVEEREKWWKKRNYEKDQYCLKYLIL